MKSKSCPPTPKESDGNLAYRHFAAVRGCRSSNTIYQKFKESRANIETKKREELDSTGAHDTAKFCSEEFWLEVINFAKPQVDSIKVILEKMCSHYAGYQKLLLKLLLLKNC